MGASDRDLIFKDTSKVSNWLILVTERPADLQGVGPLKNKCHQFIGEHKCQQDALKNK